ncbi:MFS transporter [Bacillus sp. BRMEA1]|uniref:MFS transporter n=1 Tax=Neobacillus endophyticus TaxID=2738405 RepID=UPI0015635083|nr:MFS transporter [Neobacillus endophyticus]NRD76350.1 MFS transporter [Neobacillus endophyticus]
MNKSKLWTKDFISISLSNFFVFFTFYILLVTLPSYALDDLHSSASQAGLMSTIFLLSAIISRPLAGQWLERAGNKKVLLTAMIVFTGASIFYLFPKTIGGFLLVRLLHGVGFGMATTAVGAIVADIIPSSRRGEGMGYFVLSTNMAMVLGPFIGLMAIQKWGPHIMFTLALIIAMGSLITSLSVKVKKAEEPKQIEVLSTFSFRSLIEPSAVPISTVGGFMAIAYSSLLSFVTIYAAQIHLASVSSIFFVVYAIVMLISRPFTGKCLDQFGPNYITYPCILLFAIGMFVLSHATGAATFLLAAGLIGIGWGTLFPTFQTIAIQNAEPRKRGLATATFLSIFDTGMAMGSFVVGMMAAKMDYSSLYSLFSFYIVAGAVLFYLFYTRNRKKNTSIKKEQQSRVQEI